MSSFVLNTVISLFAVYFVLAQWTLYRSLQGPWRTAAVLPTPVLAIVIVAAIASGVSLSGVIVSLAMPLAMIYLFGLAVLWLSFGRNSAPIEA